MHRCSRCGRIGPDSAAHPYYAYTLAMADTFTAQVNRNASAIMQARSYDELMLAHASGKLAGVLAVEGGHAIENDITKLKEFYALGARYFTITWNNSHPMGGLGSRCAILDRRSIGIRPVR